MQQPESSTSQDYLNQLVQDLLKKSSLELVVIIDKTLRFVAFNHRFEQCFKEWFGCSIAIGQSLQAVLAPQPAAQTKLITLWQRALDGEDFTTTEAFGDPKAPRFYELHFHVLKDPKGTILGAAHLAHDVTLRVQKEREQQEKLQHALTERRLSQELVQNSEIRYQTLIQATHCMVWQSNGAFQFIEQQSSWEDYTGQTWEEHRHHGWLAAVHPDDRQGLMAAWQEALNQHSVFDVPVRVWSREHHDHRFMLMRAAPFFNTEGQLQEWIGTNLDIQHLKQNEEQLRRMSEQFSLALKAARMGTWSWDLTTNQVHWDDNMFPLFGLKPTESNATYDYVMGLVYAEDREKLAQSLQQAAQTGLPFEAEFQVQWPDGSLHILMSKGEVYRDEKGQALKLIGVTLDMTLRKRLEGEKWDALEKAKQAEAQRAQEAENHKREQAEFTDAICHEVRTPLTAIFGCADDYEEMGHDFEAILKDENHQLPLALKKTLSNLHQRLVGTTQTLSTCVKQQKVILDDVLDFSKLGANKLELNIIPFDVKQTVSVVTQMFIPYAEQKQLELKTQISPEELLVRGDPYRLSQVLINLLSNAIKFTPAGRVMLTVERASVDPTHTRVTFNVRDTGIGMTPQEKQKLFQRFSQASSDTAREHGGSGLGLAISRQLVELMGGAFEVQSEKWQGTSFRFSVHYQNLSPQERYTLLHPTTEEIPTVKVSLIPKKILVVEDNYFNQQVLKKYIEQQGHQCVMANNGEEACNLVQKQTFDLIFMDLEMPIKGGIQATEEIRSWEAKQEKNHRPIPIIALSGNAGPEYKAKAIAAGMNGYITKPYLKRDIVEKIAAFTAAEDTQAVQQAMAAKPATLSPSTRPLYTKLTPLPTVFKPLKEEKIPSEYKNVLEQFKQNAAEPIQAKYPWETEIKHQRMMIRLPTQQPGFSLKRCQKLLADLKHALTPTATFFHIQQLTLEKEQLVIIFSKTTQVDAFKHFLQEAGLGEVRQLTSNPPRKEVKQVYVKK